MLTKDNETYPWPLPLTVMSCYEKGVSSEETAKKLNGTKTAKRFRKKYKTMQIAGTFAHLTRAKNKRKKKR